jgi:hypothetical protein
MAGDGGNRPSDKCDSEGVSMKAIIVGLSSFVRPGGVIAFQEMTTAASRLRRCGSPSRSLQPN